MFIGEWMEERNNRGEMIIATKVISYLSLLPSLSFTHYVYQYTSNFKRFQVEPKIKANTTGNNAKSLKVSVDASLQKLRTSYIDILYVHFWDFRTSIPEVMDNLNNLVVSGKVLYLGISDAPAWVVSAANEYAKAHAKAPFVIYQVSKSRGQNVLISLYVLTVLFRKGAWNVLERSFERDIIPMARHYGLALGTYCPYFQLNEALTSYA